MVPKSSVTCSVSAGMAVAMSDPAEDDAGRRAVDVETPLGVDQAAFRRPDLTADMDSLALGAQPAGRRGDRPDVVDLDLERRVAAPGRQGRVDGAGHHRIE